MKPVHETRKAPMQIALRIEVADQRPMARRAHVEDDIRAVLDLDDLAPHRRTAAARPACRNAPAGSSDRCSSNRSWVSLWVVVKPQATWPLLPITRNGRPGAVAPTRTLSGVEMRAMYQVAGDAQAEMRIVGQDRHCRSRCACRRCAQLLEALRVGPNPGSAACLPSSRSSSGSRSGFDRAAQPLVRDLLAGIAGKLPGHEAAPEQAVARTPGLRFDAELESCQGSGGIPAAAGSPCHAGKALTPAA